MFISVPNNFSSFYPFSQYFIQNYSGENEFFWSFCFTFSIYQEDMNEKMELLHWNTEKFVKEICFMLIENIGNLIK